VGDTAQPFQGCDRRYTRHFDKLTQLIDRASHAYTAADIQHRLFSLSQQRTGGVDITYLGLGFVHHGQQRCAVFQLGDLDILRDIDQHRARATGCGDFEGLIQGWDQVVDVCHHKTVLSAAQRHAQHVDFLKGVGADNGGRDLACDGHHRHRI